MISTEISILGALLLLAVISKLVLLFTKKLYDGQTRLTRVKNLMLYIGFIMMCVSTGCLYTIFFKAYLSPEKATSVMINVFGEADVELVILSLVVPCVGYFFYHIRKYRKNLSATWKNDENE